MTKDLSQFSKSADNDSVLSPPLTYILDQEEAADILLSAPSTSELSPEVNDHVLSAPPLSELTV